MPATKNTTTTTADTTPVRSRLKRSQAIRPGERPVPPRAGAVGVGGAVPGSAVTWGAVAEGIDEVTLATFQCRFSRRQCFVDAFDLDFCPLTQGWLATWFGFGRT